MTVTSPAGPASVAKARRTSAFKWVPAAAGWTVGIIATLSLFASVSPFFRSLIKVPREFVNDYIFNFPDTSFAWAFVLALLAAALAARKSIAWWILVGYMVAAIGWNVGDLVSGDESWLRGKRRDHRPRLPRRRHRVPRPGAQGVLGQGAPRRAVQSGRDARRRAGRRHPRSGGVCSSSSLGAWPARTASSTH